MVVDAHRRGAAFIDEEIYYRLDRHRKRFIPSGQVAGVSGGPRRGQDNQVRFSLASRFCSRHLGGFTAKEAFQHCINLAERHEFLLSHGREEHVGIRLDGGGVVTPPLDHSFLHLRVQQSPWRSNQLAAFFRQTHARARHALGHDISAEGSSLVCL